MLQDINASGGATFNANNAIDKGNNSGWNINAAVGKDLFWVGGTGKWDEPAHWAESSGGIGGTCIPSSIDNVIFDGQSFSFPNQSVTVNVRNALCNSMTWTGAAFSPTFKCDTITRNLRIYGSLTLITGMTWNFTGQTFFESTTIGKTITSAGRTFINHVFFEGLGGGWMLLDAFNTTGYLFLNYGSLNTNSKNVFCKTFNSDNTNIRGLTLGNSVFTCNSPAHDYNFRLNSDNLVFNAGTSTFKMFGLDTNIYPAIIRGSAPLVFYNIENTNTNNCTNEAYTCWDIRTKVTIHKLTIWNKQFRLQKKGSFNNVKITIDSLLITGDCEKVFDTIYNLKIQDIVCSQNSSLVLNTDPLDTIQNILFNGFLCTINGDNSKFHKVILNRDANIKGNNTFDSLTFAPGYVYYLSSGKTQTIINNFSAPGTCSGNIVINATSIGSQATLFKSGGVVTVNYCILQDMNATGGAVFGANNSFDMGNNSGWTISPGAPLNLFWVGGSGNWNDSGHWSLISGGTGGACIPSPIDNVIFDLNSFTSSNQSVTINTSNAFCNSMSWTVLTLMPVITGSSTNTLHIYGSLTLVSGMNWSFPGKVHFASSVSGNIITMAAKTFVNDVTFQGSYSGSWTLADAFKTSGTLFLNYGSLNTNNQSVDCKIFDSDNSNNRTLSLGNSVITCNSYTGNSVENFRLNSNNLIFNSGTSIFKFSGNNNVDFPVIIRGSAPLVFHDIEITNLNAGILKWDVRTKVTIRKFITQAPSYQLASSLAMNQLKIIIDSLIIINGEALFDWGTNNYQLKIQEIVCTQNSKFYLKVDMQDSIHNILFNGNLCYIFNIGTKFHKVILNGDGTIYGNNTFDTLTFAAGRNYLLGSGSTQIINNHFSALGNGCFPITIRATTSGTRSTISKTAGNVVCGYLELRDQKATGGASFYAGTYSTNVSNNTGWNFTNGPGYIYGLGADTSYCEGDTLLLTTEHFYGGSSWLWQDGSTNSFYKVTQPGTYWVEVTYSNNCFYADTIHVTQKPKPVAVATSNSPVCSGDTLKFYGTGGTSYSWIGPVGYLSTLQNPKIINSSPANSGNYLLIATHNGCSSFTDTVPVQVEATVIASVSINASANPACEGASVTFTAIPAGGGTAPAFLWFKNNIPVGSGITYTCVPNDGDVVYVVMTSNLLCKTGSPAASPPVTMAVIAYQPVSVSILASENPVCTGNSVTFTATPGGGGITPVYQWFKNNIPVAGGLNYSFIPANGDVVYVEMTSSLLCTTGNPATSTSISMVVITEVVASVSIASTQNNVCAGTSVTFTATPGEGGPTPYFQWFKNNIAVETGLSYTFVPANNDKVYAVMTSSLSCATGNPATSDTVTMTVNPNLPVSLSIAASANPVCDGTLVTFTAMPANGGANPGYQWKKSGIDLAGATNATYNYIPANGDVITCILASNATCATGSPATSNTVTMTVNPNLPVSLSVVASANPVCDGTMVAFAAMPTNGGANPGYQWKKSGIDIAGATNETYSYIPANGDAVTCVLASNATCATGSPASSNVVTMTVNPNLPVSLSIAASANPVCDGTLVTFTAMSTNGGANPGYQWKKIGIDLAGATNATYSYFPANGDDVTCVLTSNATCATGSPATSEAVMMTVNPNLPVSLSISALANPVCDGTLVTFTATPNNGGANPAYQWKKGVIDITGATNATYSYFPANSDVVTCILASNATCASGSPAISNVVMMTVNPNLPVSLSMVASANPVCDGTLVAFAAMPTNGGTNPAYQWKKGGTDIAGSTNSTYSYIPANGDVVSCMLASNATCATGSPATSNTVTMTVIQNLPVSISIATSANPVCEGTEVTFSAMPINGGTLPAYLWKVNGTVAGSNNPAFTYLPVDGDGIICILNSSGECIENNPAMSNELSMVVKNPPVATLHICPSVITRDTRPFILKGGLPLGGTFSGAGVQGTMFDPSLVPGAQTSAPVKYICHNVFNCSDTASQEIVILPGNSAFQCGQPFSDIRDNQVYSTRLIGTQCWMTQNLNHGTFINSNEIQADNCLPEKYCYNNNSSDCTTKGGLYQWDELLQYNESEPVQGLCPPGWHVSSETEWLTLLTTMNGPGLAGDSLKIDGSSGFIAILPGLNYQNNTWAFDNFTTFYWTSTSSGTIQSIAHGLNIQNGSVSKYMSNQACAFSIRCIRD